MRIDNAEIERREKERATGYGPTHGLKANCDWSSSITTNDNTGWMVYNQLTDSLISYEVVE